MQTDGIYFTICIGQVNLKSCYICMNLNEQERYDWIYFIWMKKKIQHLTSVIIQTSSMQVVYKCATVVIYWFKCVLINSQAYSLFSDVQNTVLFRFVVLNIQ